MKSDTTDDTRKAALRMKILKLVGEYAERYVAGSERKIGEDRIPYSGSVLDQKEIQGMVRSALTGWFGAGQNVARFENNIADLHETNHALMTNSGSSANLVAVTTLCSHQLGDKRLKPGQEVITAATTFPTTLNPILQNRLVPVFVDTDLETLNLDTTQLDAALSEKTAAVFIPHILGNPVDMGPVVEFVEENNLYLIEDICDSLCSKYRGKKVGTFGDMATMSFYPAHHITTGEGGAIMTDEVMLDRISRSVRDWGRACWCKTDETNPLGACGRRFDFSVDGVPYDHKYLYANIGYNLKPMDLQGAIGLAQLDKLPEFTKTRKRNHSLLKKMLSDIDGADIFITQETRYSDPNWFAFPFTLIADDPQRTQDLVLFLERNLITTRRMFGGNILRHDAYKNMDYEYRCVGELKMANKILRSTLFVGVYPGLSEEEIRYIGQKILEYFGYNR